MGWCEASGRHEAVAACCVCGACGACVECAGHKGRLVRAADEMVGRRREASDASAASGRALITADVANPELPRLAMPRVLDYQMRKVAGTAESVQPRLPQGSAACIASLES